MHPTILVLCAVAGCVASPCLAVESETFDVVASVGPNYSVAAFRFWVAPGIRPVHGVAILVPGSNSDGRAEVNDALWRAFALRHDLALVGCYFKDHPHDNMNIEEYARAGDGSGGALLEALLRFAVSSNRPEIARAPLLLWGISAGGEFNYEFACWKPERVIAFVVNKGGYYFTHLAPAATRNVPGLFFVGADDADFRKKSIEGIYAVNHEAGARWKLVIEPHVGHALGNSQAMAMDFFEKCLSGSPPN